MTSVEVFISDETSARVINTSVSTTDNSPSLDSVDNQTTQSNVTSRLLFYKFRSSPWYLMAK